MEGSGLLNLDIYPIVKPVDYQQGDQRWQDIPYAVDGEQSTIKTAGCGPTVLADVLAAIVSPYIDPLTCASWARMKGFKILHSGTSYRYPEAQAAEYGVKVTRLNTVNAYGRSGAAVHREALEQLLQSNWLIACMGKGLWTKSGHYVLVYGYMGGMVYINDPASRKKERIFNKWVNFKTQVKYYWAVEVPEDVKQGKIATEGKYRQQDFVRECQMCLGAGIDGVAGRQTLYKTVTVSAQKNRKHKVVLPLQKWLKKQGFYKEKIDDIAGRGFTAAVNTYQMEVLGYGKTDGTITQKGKMWRCLLQIQNTWLL